MHLRIALIHPLSAHARIGQVMELAVAIAGGAGVYLLCAKGLHMEEWEPFWSQIRARRAIVETSE
jgi:hypothetical protein